MLSFDEALERVLNKARPLGDEQIAMESAVGRFCAEYVRAEVALPPFDQSAMDGYAVRTADFYGSGPWYLPVVAESKAGKPLTALEGGCCRIFTGAQIPAPADAVVLQEEVTRSGDTVTFAEHPRPGDHIRRKGEDVSPGDLVIEHGERLNPFHLGLLASLERQALMVARRPRVTILCSGDELRRPGTPVTPGSIAESNSLVLAKLIECAGGVPTVGPLVPDVQERATELIGQACADADLVVTVGGVSVGDHDVMRAAMQAAGVELDFWKVRIKPGKPLVVGEHEHCLVLGLPGNPVSAQLTCCLFVQPLLYAMQHAKHPLPKRTIAVLGETVSQKPGRLGFLRVRMAGEQVFPLHNQSSGFAGSLAHADALALIPEQCAKLEAGERVELLMLN